MHAHSEAFLPRAPPPRRLLPERASPLATGTARREAEKVAAAATIQRGVWQLQPEMASPWVAFVASHQLPAVATPEHWARAAARKAVPRALMAPPMRRSAAAAFPGVACRPA